MSISTISRWLCGNTKVINNKSLQRLVRGEKVEGVEAIKQMKLYLALLTLGFSKSFLNKRYMIDVINDLNKGGEKDKTLLKLSKITSVVQIEKANYAEGEVIAQIKSIINADYDTWRKEHNIGFAEEAEAIKMNTILNTVTEKDIEAYLSTNTNSKVISKKLAQAA